MSTLKLAANALYDGAGKALAEAIANNKHVEKLGLQKNSISCKYIEEVEAKTCEHATAAKKQQLPRYESDLMTMADKQDRMQDLAHKHQEIDGARAELERQLSHDNELFEDVKVKERIRYATLQAEYERIIQVGQTTESDIVDCDAQIVQTTHELESKITSLSRRTSALASHLPELEQTGLSVFRCGCSGSGEAESGESEARDRGRAGRTEGRVP